MLKQISQLKDVFFLNSMEMKKFVEMKWNEMQ